MKCNFLIVLSGIIVSGLFVACTGKPKEAKKEARVIAKTEVKVTIDRFEKDLFSINIDSVEKYVPKLKAKYGEFFEMFNYKIVGLGDSNDPQYPAGLKKFLADYYMSQDYKRVIEVYPKLDDLSQKLATAFTKFKEYFPDKRLPHVYTCISGWNQSIVTADTLIGIALDKYLGRKCEFYEKLQTEMYLRYTMQREYILPDAMRAWGYTTFELSDSLNTFLCKMLYEGKIMFYLKKVLPETPDTIIFGYTPVQLKWCNNNAKQMWTYLIEHKLLFSTQFMIVRKLLYPSPFTSFYTRESPGRATVWLAYKVIEAYMDNNKDVTLSRLMQERDYQMILRKSNFKP